MKFLFNLILWIVVIFVGIHYAFKYSPTFRQKFVEYIDPKAKVELLTNKITDGIANFIRKELERGVEKVISSPLPSKSPSK